MTQESKDTQKEEPADSQIKPPMPDVPAETNPPPFPPSEPKPEEAPASPSAQMKMAGEIESGGTPYNYDGELEEDRASGQPPPAVNHFSFTRVAALTAVGALILITVVGWRIIENVSIKIDGINSNVEKLADRFLVESRLARKTGKAVVRAELQKSLMSLERLMATGDPLIKAEAIKLQNEIMEVMALIGAGAGVVVKKQIDIPDQAGSAPALEPEPELTLEPEPELTLEPEPELTVDIEESSGGGGESEPDSPENVKQDEVEAAYEQAGQSP
ncbi:hypothetical protein MNBD_NITROSPINAE03-1800 [hydrothermal vent metagenome]|uniref:Uncharacterized protein n=1 Tax=hydrothermal vent metagenome TaxID=652676 RepID=A0A3B1CR30_9ZZZZ